MTRCSPPMFRRPMGGNGAASTRAKPASIRGSSAKPSLSPGTTREYGIGQALKADGKGQIATGATALSTGRPRGTIDLMWNEIFKRWIDLLFWWVPKDEAKPPEAKERAPSATEESAGHEPEVTPQVVLTT